MEEIEPYLKMFECLHENYYLELTLKVVVVRKEHSYSRCISSSITAECFCFFFFFFYLDFFTFFLPVLYHLCLGGFLCCLRSCISSCFIVPRMKNEWNAKDICLGGTLDITRVWGWET